MFHRLSRYCFSYCCREFCCGPRCFRVMKCDRPTMHQMSTFAVAALLTLFGCVAALRGTDSAGSTPPEQRSALEELFASTNGSGWSTNCVSGWMSTTVAPCSWFGVACDVAQNIVGLTIVDCGLGGTLPLGLQNLPYLDYLLLNLNNIGGTLPAWSSFESLQTLSLYHNSITGSLPGAWSNISLSSLSLQDNLLTGPLPDEWSTMALKSLSLQNNLLSGTLPAAWGALFRMKTLVLSHNSLEGTVPLEWYSLVSQTEKTLTLDLSYNLLSGDLPQWNGTEYNSNIGNLDLSNNRFNGTLPTWSGVYSVQSLNLSSNMLTGSFPSAWNPITFVTLDLSGNMLSGSLDNMTAQLTNLYIQRNQFSGNLSFLDSLLDQSKILDLSDNAFTGDIPPIVNYNYECYDFESPCKCFVNLQNNYLQGGIPPSFCELAMGIALDGNCLTNTTTPSSCIGNSRTCHISASTQREGNC